MNIRAALLAAVLTAPGSDTAADDARPPIWTESQTWTANVESDPVQAIEFGQLGLELEKSTLADIRARIGSGRIFQNGDAAESLSWLCYVFVSSGSKQTVWLSSSEMGGGEVIDSVTAMPFDSKAPAHANCTQLARSPAPIRLANGIWLGSTSKQVLSALGQPQKHGDSWSYVFEGKTGEYDVSSILAFKLRDGTVVGISSSHVTTN